MNVETCQELAGELGSDRMKNVWLGRVRAQGAEAGAGPWFDTVTRTISSS